MSNVFPLTIKAIKTVVEYHCGCETHELKLPRKRPLEFHRRCDSHPAPGGAA